jgi:serine/threonine protein kinase
MGIAHRDLKPDNIMLVTVLRLIGLSMANSVIDATSMMRAPVAVV